MRDTPPDVIEIAVKFRSCNNGYCVREDDECGEKECCLEQRHIEDAILADRASRKTEN